MSDACYLEHYCFRHRLYSYSRAARFLRFITCYTSSLFCHSLSYDKLHPKTAAPNEKSTWFCYSRLLQIFFHVLILNTVYLLASPAIEDKLLGDRAVAVLGLGAFFACRSNGDTAVGQLPAVLDLENPAEPTSGSNTTMSNSPTGIAGQIPASWGLPA